MDKVSTYLETATRPNSFVDKRINENFTRVSRQEPQVKALVQHIDKGGLYFGVPEKVQRWDRTLNARTSGL